MDNRKIGNNLAFKILYIFMETKEKVIEMMLRFSEKRKEEIREEDDLYNDLGYDSLDTVELMMDIEKEFGIQIDEEYTDKWMTVKDVLDTIKFLMLKKMEDES